MTLNDDADIACKQTFVSDIMNKDDIGIKLKIHKVFKKLLNTDYADDTDRRGFIALSVLIRAIRVIRVQKNANEAFKIIFCVWIFSFLKPSQHKMHTIRFL